MGALRNVSGLRLLKLGGSLLTDKARRCTLRRQRLAGLAAAVERSARADGPLVVVHGAGSFGHHGAREHRLAEGADGSARQRRGAATVQQEVLTLHQAVVGALLDAGVAAVSVPPRGGCLTDKGRLVSWPQEQVVRWLQQGAVPVLFGDVVVDRVRGLAILSGDALLEAMATQLRPAPVRAVFAMDVPGVLRAPPQAGVPIDAGDVVPELSCRSLSDLGAGLRLGEVSLDVTGGILAKVAVAGAMARAGVPTALVGGQEPSTVVAALRGARTLGTVIR